MKAKVVALASGSVSQIARNGVVRKIKIDPHFSYANQLCDVAWSRAHNTAPFIFPDGAAANDRRNLAEAMVEQGLQASVAEHLKPLPPGEVCGCCTECPIGPHGPPDRFYYEPRQFETAANDPGCAMFVPV